MPKVRKTGCRRPGACPACPLGVELAAQQRGNGKGEGHREADITHVEHGRVEDHPRVLQQGIEVAAVGGRGQQAVEGVAGHQHEEQETHRHQAHHAQHAGHEGQRHAGAVAGHGHRPAAEHQHPEQQRAFVAAPDRSDAVGQGQGAVRVRRHVEHREVVAHEADRQQDEGDQDEGALGPSQGAGHQHPVVAAALRPGQRQHALHQGRAEREEEQEVTDLGRHGRAPWAIVLRTCSAFFRASAASGGM